MFKQLGQLTEQINPLGLHCILCYHSVVYDIGLFGIITLIHTIYNSSLLTMTLQCAVLPAKILHVIPRKTNTTLCLFLAWLWFKNLPHAPKTQQLKSPTSCAAPISFSFHSCLAGNLHQILGNSSLSLLPIRCKYRVFVWMSAPCHPPTPQKDKD